MANIEEKVQSLLEPIVNELGYEIYDVEYAKEGKDYFLRIYIDNEKGISLEDCEKVTNGINNILDQADYIKEGYFLEVSSPGIERILRKDRHLKENIGNEIELKLFKPIDKQKNYYGLLVNFDEENIYIKINEIEISIERKQIAQVKLKYNW